MLMLMFKYVGRTKKGEIKRGTMEGQSRNEVVLKLRERGISPREITETKPSIFNRNISINRNTVKNEHFVIYCRQFATLIRAGVTIVDATNILMIQTESKALKHVLKLVESDIKSGIAFSDAVEKHPKIFPTLFVNMIRAGEMTGSLDDTLEHTSELQSRGHLVCRLLLEKKKINRDSILCRSLTSR